MERECRRRARARVGWAGVDDDSRPRGCELRPCARREQQSAQEREENGKEDAGHVARSPFGAGSGSGVGGGVQDPTGSRRARTPVVSAKAVPMRTRPGSRNFARGGTTTDSPCPCRPAREVYHATTWEWGSIAASGSTSRLSFSVTRSPLQGFPGPQRLAPCPHTPPARSWGTGIPVNRQLSRDPCPPQGGVRGHLVHDEGEGSSTRARLALEEATVVLGLLDHAGRSSGVPRPGQTGRAGLASASA